MSNDASSSDGHPNFSNEDCICPRNWDPICFRAPDGTWREYGNFCGFKCAWKDTGLIDANITKAQAAELFSGSLFQGECSEHVVEKQADSEPQLAVEADAADCLPEADFAVDEILAAMEASVDEFDL